ncbi:hypothetical protein HN011_009219 [Eciton burchellii]|nr:hypothetical protein HN011_009219 [Eciton burchellii]
MDYFCRDTWWQAALYQLAIYKHKSLDRTASCNYRKDARVRIARKLAWSRLVSRHGLPLRAGRDSYFYQISRRIWQSAHAINARATSEETVRFLDLELLKASIERSEGDRKRPTEHLIETP